MFEPLPSFIRLRRLQRNLTQERLAKLAGVSRQQLALLEEGNNVSLAFLLKVARALELTELPIAELTLRQAPVDLVRTVQAADVVARLKQSAHQWASAAGEINEASASLDALIAAARPSGVSGRAIVEAAERLEHLPAAERHAAGEAIRSANESGSVAQAARTKTAAARPTARHRR
jgi:transcriptional regulator with XRE-family HTH domain